MGIVRNLFSRKGRKAKEAAAVATMPSQPAPTKLMMLMPDASGIATYRLHTFLTAGQAEDYLVSTLRGDVQEGTIMFWGLTWSPSDNGNQNVEAEPVVLIRDPSRPGLVYTFSFVDLDSAYDFVRHEMKAGLDLTHTAIFWAVPAEATANHWGEITVTPDRPPTREPAPNGAAPLAPPAPFMAPDHDEPNGTQLHIDEPSPVRLPEVVFDEPESARAPEAADEPESAEKPAHNAVEDEDVSNVIDILQAKRSRTPSNPPQPIDEPAPEDTADLTDELSHAGKGDAHAGQEAEHIDLSDVFGGRRDPEPPTTPPDFRWSREGRQANGVNGAAESAIEEPADTVSGIVAAWSNIGAAIDRAIDAHVARHVSDTIAWRRLTRAFAAAASVRLLLIWGRLTQALYAAAAMHSSRERALAAAWRNATRALHQAAESNSGHRAMRLAWANISSTLEEAVYDARLQQGKAAARTSWSTATSALRAAAVIRQSRFDSGLRTAWQRLAVGSVAAAYAQESRRARTVFAWASTGTALNDYVTAKLHHDGLVVAWTRLAAAINEATETAARRAPVLAQAWHHLTRAFATAANARLLVAWRPITQALYAGAAIQLARERALAAAWRNATRALHQAAESKSGRRAKRLAWANISWTLEEAVYAARLRKKKAAARAWPNASVALAVAARKKDAVDRGLRTAWRRLAAGALDAANARARLVFAWTSIGKGLTDAVEAMYRHKRIVFAWTSTGIALNDYVTMKLRHDGLVATWLRLAAAIEEAVYAAGLQRKKAAALAWSNAAGALAVAACKKDAVDRGLRTAWRRLAAGTLDAANARARLVFAWTSIGKGLTDAVEAMYRHKRIVFAWASTGIALNDYVTAKLQRDGLVFAWTSLSAAVEEAAAENIRHIGLIRAWRVLSLEIFIAARLQAEHCKRAAVQAWGNAMLALSEAGVAEAQVRIAEAGLNEGLMKGVISAIRKVKGRKASSASEEEAYLGRKLHLASSESGKEAVKLAVSSAGAATEKTAREMADKGSASPNTVAKATKTKTSKKAANSRGKAKSAAKPVAKKRSAVEQQVAALETWRSRESARFSEKKDPFESFGSPPGRF